MAHLTSPKKKKTRVHRSEAMPSGGAIAVDTALTTYLKKKGQYGKQEWNRYMGPDKKDRKGKAK